MEMVSLQYVFADADAVLSYEGTISHKGNTPSRWDSSYHEQVVVGETAAEHLVEHVGPIQHQRQPARREKLKSPQNHR